MPQPSSVTRMRERPPEAVTTSISRRAGVERVLDELLHDAAGRSMTSPAAMRLIVSGDSWRMAMAPPVLWERSS